MKSTTTIILTLSSLAVALPQGTPSLAGLPVCAQNAALTGATGSGCSLTDAECFCKNTGFVGGLKAAIGSSCAGADQVAACSWGNSACSTYSVSIDCGLSPAPTQPETTDNSSAAPADNANANMASSIPTNPAAVVPTNVAASPASAPAGMDGMSMTSMAAAMPTGTDSMGTMSATMMNSGMPLMTTSAMSKSMNGTGSGMGAMTHSTMNGTHSATGSSTMSGGPTMYTGAASAAGTAGRGGVLGVVVGVMLGLAFY